MTATILTFPSRNPDCDRLASIWKHLKVAMPIVPGDPELDHLLKIAGKLPCDVDDHRAVDSRLVRLDQWEGRKLS